jgi:multidrug efflux pump subunit AcrA (membrane-fusion protein)
MRPRRIIAAGTAVCLSGAAAAAFAVTSGGTSAATTAVPTGVASVVRTDLAVQDAVSGTVGYEDQYAIYGPAGMAAQAVAQLRQTATADQLAVAADQTAMADAANTANEAISQQRGALANAHTAASADQTQTAQDQTQQATDQQAVDAATAKQATDGTQLTNDTAAQRAQALTQLANQQQLATTQTNATHDQATATTDTQQLATDQHTLAGDAQALTAAQQTLQSDQDAAARDCPSSPQCGADQSKVALDQQNVAAAQQHVTADQSAVNTDQASVNSAQSAVNNDQTTLAALQQQLDGEATALMRLGFAVADDQAVVQQDATAVNTAKAALTADQAKVQADTNRTGVQDPAALSTAQFGVAAAGVSAAQSLHQAEARLATDASALQSAEDAFATASATALGPGTTLTWLPRTGQTITAGQPVYAMSGVPVPLLYGPTPLYRSLQAGVSDGPDVRELNADLGLPASAHFSAATTTSLRAWQGAHGLAPTGTLGLGQAVVEPGPFRISTVAGSLGTSLGTNAILDATSTALVVTAQIPLSDLGLVNPGDAVTVDLPDGHNGAAGRIRDIGVSVTPSGGNGQNNGNNNNQGSSSSSSGQSPATTVAATVTFSDPSVARGLNQAAVLVHVTTQTVHGVLAVPVDALLALSGGGEGVEVVTGARRQVVTVTTGVFTGTLVEVSGGGLSAGEQVEVPSS